MLNLIPIHNAYAIASFVNLTLGSFFISSHISQRWLKKFDFSLLDANALVKGGIVLFGLTIISPERLFNGSLIIQLTVLILGSLLGILYFKFEVWIVKLLPHKNKFSSKYTNNSQFKTTNIKNRLNNKFKSEPPKNDFPSYLSAGIVGVLEELLFRGFLTILCFEFSNYVMSVGCLILVNFAFGLSHINLGFLHVFTKMILGFLCLISFIYLGSICAPIAIHTVFNLLAVKKIRESYYG